MAETKLTAIYVCLRAPCWCGFIWLLCNARLFPNQLEMKVVSSSWFNDNDHHSIMAPFMQVLSDKIDKEYA